MQLGGKERGCLLQTYTQCSGVKMGLWKDVSRLSGAFIKHLL